MKKKMNSVNWNVVVTIGNRTELYIDTVNLSITLNIQSQASQSSPKGGSMPLIIVDSFAGAG